MFNDESRDELVIELKDVLVMKTKLNQMSAVKRKSTLTLYLGLTIKF